MTQPSLSIDFSEDNEAVPTADQILNILAVLPIEVGRGLREKLNDVLKAYAPGPFCDALGDLEAYLSALDDTRLMPFESQISLKNYVMHGWREWRGNFKLIEEL